MPKIHSHTRKTPEPSAELYGTSDQSTSEEEEITDIIQLDISNTVFLSIAGLLLTCAVFLLRSRGFLPVINGIFLSFSALTVAALELYQPVKVMAVMPFWNSGISRGMILVWLSIIAMNGFWLAGFLSFILSIAVVLSHFLIGAQKLRPVFYDEVTMKPIFDHAPALKPLFYSNTKNGIDGEERKEEG